MKWKIFVQTWLKNNNLKEISLNYKSGDIVFFVRVKLIKDMIVLIANDVILYKGSCLSFNINTFYYKI